MPANAVVSISRSNFVVRVQPGTDVAVRTALTSMGDIPTDEIDYVFDGFVVKLSAPEAAALVANPNVVSVTPDAPISLLDTDTNPPSWGLDRVDQTSLPLDSSFSYPNQGGAGVRVYIVDTGVQADNPDFAGRILPGFDVIGNQQQNTDCHGHGTHVAGTVAGTRYGLAKKASIVPVRVLGCTGSGTFSGIITALDWIKQNNPVGTPAVINMSIGGGFYQAVNDAVEALVGSGITAAIAAGNSNADACQTSPASAPSAITVGATSSTDARASFSNFGNCVDIFAPGVNIVSDDAFAAGSSKTMSGTSMASPHVAGAAALVLGQNPTFKPADVVKALQDNASVGQVVGSSSAHDGLLNISFLNAANTAPTPIAGVPDAPTAPKATNISASGATISWTTPANDGGSPITGYKVAYRESAVSNWTTVSATATSVALTGLASLASYQVQVSATNAIGDSLPTANISFTTLGSLADAPTGLAVLQDKGSSVYLGWTAPANGGNSITGYTAQMLVNGAWVTQATTGTTPRVWVTKLTPLSAYSIRIFATNASGNGPATQLDYTTGPLAPAAPTVNISAITGKGATIGWTTSAATDPAYPVSYELTYGYAVSLTPRATIVQSTNASVVISDLIPTTLAWVRVVAKAGKSTSDGVYSTFTTTADAPSAPYFSTPVKTTSGYNLSWMTATANGSPIIDYALQTSTSNATTAVWTDVTVTSASSYVVPMPAPGKLAYYRVAARNSVGLSAYSTAVAVNGPTSISDAPGNLAGVATGTKAVLTWTAPAYTGGLALSYYTLQYSRDNGANWLPLASVTATAAGQYSYTTAISFAKGTTVQFRAFAINSAGTSPTSAIATVNFAASAATAPLSFKATVANSGDAAFSWLAPTDNGGSTITGYRLERLSGNVVSTLIEVAGNALSATANLGLPGTTTLVRISAITAAGTGLPSAWVSFVVPFQRVDAPTGLVGSVNATTGQVNLSWSAPASLYGGHVASFVAQLSTNGGSSWSQYAFAAPVGSNGSGSVAVPGPLKGLTYGYRVAIVTEAGQSAWSTVISVTRDASVPAAPVTRGTSVSAAGIPTLLWNAVSDNGGSSLTGYRIEQNTSNGWAAVATVAASQLTWVGSVGAPGTQLQFRVVAVNAIGASLPSNVLTVAVPLLKPAAPSDLTIGADPANAARAIASWTNPTYFGGAPQASYYLVEVSSNGTNWSGYMVSATATSFAFARPAKGVTYQLRVVTVTGFGRSDASNQATIATAATAPSAPYGARVGFGADGNPIFAWYAPADNGGSPITSYLVELGTSASGSTAVAWSASVSVSGTQLATTGLRGAPGSSHYVRVTAVNALGNSATSAVGFIMVPLLKPAAPTQVSAGQLTAGSTNVTLRWNASTDLGGAISANYQIERSADNGSTWSVVLVTSLNTAVVAGPPKGTSGLFRIGTRTGFGLGDYAGAVSVVSATTVPANPASVTGALSTDGTNIVTLRWTAPTDSGGTAITGYRIDRNESSSAAWSTIANVDGATLSAQLPFSAPGVVATYRVYAINAVGVSAAAVVYQVRMPYVAPAATSAPVVSTSSTSTVNSPRIVLTWAAASSFGGSSLSMYQLQQSTDGNNWSLVAGTSATSWTMIRPANGTSVFYRVVTTSVVGMSAASAVTTATF